MADQAVGSHDGELTAEEKKQNVLRCAFDGDEAKYREFCDLVRVNIPTDTAVILRGSSVTGKRWRDGAPFDAEGPGTSDLDLTFVGAEALKLFVPNGFFVPEVHSRPLGPDDPDIAPDLVPLREQLMALVHRNVNIQASRDVVIQFRGDVLGQPYHVLIDKPGWEHS
jgi:hypothetical protein